MLQAIRLTPSASLHSFSIGLRTTAYYESFDCKTSLCVDLFSSVFIYILRNSRTGRSPISFRCRDLLQCHLNKNAPIRTRSIVLSAYQGKSQWLLHASQSSPRKKRIRQARESDYHSHCYLSSGQHENSTFPFSLLPCLRMSSKKTCSVFHLEQCKVRGRVDGEIHQIGAETYPLSSACCP